MKRVAAVGVIIGLVWCALVWFHWEQTLRPGFEGKWLLGEAKGTGEEVGRGNREGKQPVPRASLSGDQRGQLELAKQSLDIAWLTLCFTVSNIKTSSGHIE